MAKAAPTSIPDMIERHAEIYRETDRLYDLGGDDATDTSEYQVLSDEAIDLDYRIVATRAAGRADIDAKRRFIRKTGFIDYKCSGLSTGSVQQLVDMILRLDTDAVRASVAQPRERIAAAD